MPDSVPAFPLSVSLRARKNVAAQPRPLTTDELLVEVRRLGLSTPNESTSIIRADRDSR